MDYIFFDFNGTLVDDVDLCLYLLNVMLKSCDHDEVSKDRYLDIFTFPVKEYYVRAGFDFKKDNWDELASFFVKEYKIRNVECKLFNDIVSTLKTLKEKGKHLYILSASEKNMLLEQLKMYGIESYFDEILGKDNIYAEGKEEMGKNYMKKMNLAIDKCVFVGDTLHDEETAYAMGIKCYLVSRGHQSEKVLKTSSSKVFNTIAEINFDE